MQIYCYDLNILTIVAIISVILFSIFAIAFNKKTFWKIVCIISAIASALIIIKFSVLGRKSGDVRHFEIMPIKNDETIREMFMNALLYLPLGISLPYAFKNLRKPIFFSMIFAFLLSFIIELWQFVFATGLAQSTDVIMNVLGFAIGNISFILVNLIIKKQKY